ncbi:hypothetical protein K443DRAFT_359851 [Laccaria amethystina LaAM-08-1]|uniref:Uncharacterized protein n=1 Tax=Laccaria amethystina LaAM-08-1 TaxID=1095629 RepID=A0A0C9Y565_9AGAR|nr:hypothetical protein K443DRAFT_359851 [Laccaria amethystina LaAM-08-1]
MTLHQRVWLNTSVSSLMPAYTTQHLCFEPSASVYDQHHRLEPNTSVSSQTLACTAAASPTPANCRWQDLVGTRWHGHHRGSPNVLGEENITSLLMYIASLPVP